jgi:hypothetical protein
MAEEFIYDEEAAVKFIRQSLPDELRERFSEDGVYYLLDVICDFYDEHDYLNEDDDEREERELTQYIVAQAKKDKIGDFTEEEIRIVLAAEAAYTDTLDIQ